MLFPGSGKLKPDYVLMPVMAKFSVVTEFHTNLKKNTPFCFRVSCDWLVTSLQCNTMPKNRSWLYFLVPSSKYGKSVAPCQYFEFQKSFCDSLHFDSWSWQICVCRPCLLVSSNTVEVTKEVGNQVTGT